MPGALLLAALGGCHESGRIGPATSTAAGVTDPYAAGPFAVDNVVLEAGEQGAPKRTRLFVPVTPGTYPMVQFNHGFQGSVDSFQTVLTHLASHGFIVVAPQLVPGPAEGGNPGTAPSIADEVLLATETAHWAQSSLPAILSVGADINRYGLAGHSRGGQVMWRMLLDNPGIAQAIAGIDPVDGDAPPFSGSTGPLITAAPFNQGVPSYTLGTGLGATGGPVACAPENRNYRLFYDASSSPAWVTLAEDYGHADMVDTGGAETLACASNPLRTGMIVFTGGQLVAFFADALQGADSSGFLEDLSTAPITASSSFK